MEREEKQAKDLCCGNCEHYADHVGCCCVFNIPVCKNDCCGYAEKMGGTVSTADVVEVVHGEWKREQNRRTCSCCEFVYYDNGGLFNYCPNCGAKMDGGNKDG